MYKMYMYDDGKKARAATDSRIISGTSRADAIYATTRNSGRKRKKKKKRGRRKGVIDISSL